MPVQHLLMLSCIADLLEVVVGVLRVVVHLPVPRRTTEFRFFAECLKHLANAKLHLAKPLPSAALGKEHTAKN